MYSENQTRSNTVHISLMSNDKNLFEKHNHIKENIQKLKPDSIKVCVGGTMLFMRVLNTEGISSQRQLSAHTQGEILKYELHSMATMGRGGVETTNLAQDVGLKATGSVTVATHKEGHEMQGIKKRGWVRIFRHTAIYLIGRLEKYNSKPTFWNEIAHRRRLTLQLRLARKLFHQCRFSR